MSREVAVIGATGRQGGAVARVMAASGWRVRAVTRDSTSRKLALLRDHKVTVVRADLFDTASLTAALEGCEAAFGVTNFWEHGYLGELTQGRNIIQAARDASVGHLVFSSVGGTDRTAGLGITHFDAKREIERELTASGLAWTILRPVTFLENFRSELYRRAIAKGGVLRFGFSPGRRFQMVAMRDIAAFALLAFEGDKRVQGKATEIASDSFKMEEFAQALSEAAQRNVRYRKLSPALLQLIASFIEITKSQARYKAGRSLIAQFAWNNHDPQGGWAADIERLRGIHPSLLRMREWVAGFNWRQLD
jgi:uncharacterized protein YbjT (DUF2867 family)